MWHSHSFPQLDSIIFRPNFSARSHKRWPNKTMWIPWHVIPSPNPVTVTYGRNRHSRHLTSAIRPVQLWIHFCYSWRVFALWTSPGCWSSSEGSEEHSRIRSRDIFPNTSGPDFRWRGLPWKLRVDKSYGWWSWFNFNQIFLHWL